jgi:hypothetical protein
MGLNIESLTLETIKKTKNQIKSRPASKPRKEPVILNKSRQLGLKQLQKLLIFNPKS